MILVIPALLFHIRSQGSRVEILLGYHAQVTIPNMYPFIYKDTQLVALNAMKSAVLRWSKCQLTSDR